VGTGVKTPAESVTPSSRSAKPTGTREWSGTVIRSAADDSSCESRSSTRTRRSYTPGAGEKVRRSEMVALGDFVVSKRGTAIRRTQASP
jgi:hypothetical protein